MAGVAVQERLPATAGAHDRDTVPALDIADPDMTQAARRARAAWRREHLAEWQRELEALCHFDPEFVYDTAHEYDEDFTTDPDYDTDGVHFLEYDADGVVSPLEKRAWTIQAYGADTASDMLVGMGLERDYERLVRFRPETIEHANQDYPRKPSQFGRVCVRTCWCGPSCPPSERERFMPDGVLRLDLGAPVPPLVLEVLSESSAERDLNYKKHLYAAAGVSEYLVYDLGASAGRVRPRHS